MEHFASMFRINGKPMFAPDADVAVQYEDVESEDSGTDEGGFLHRIVARHKVGTWSFEYATITDAQRRYMESLFPDEPDFAFTHPDRLRTDQTVTTRAYRSGYGITWHNAVTGLWHNYKFEITEC